MANIVGIGTDIVECLRIAQLIERHGERFLQRVFTADEIQYCSSRKLATQHFAGRWAAKGAVLKALGTAWTRDIAWRDIEVQAEPAGRPQIVLRGEVSELADRVGAEQLLISIGHCRTHATAYAMALSERDMFE